MNWTLQFGFFLLAGTATTLVDFLGYNVLTSRRFGLSRIAANCCSSTVAMAFSYTVNLLLVFHPLATQASTRAARFFAVTCVSSYLLQNVVIYFTGKVWLSPARMVQNTITLVFPAADESLAQKNAVKLLAVSAGLLWNFLWYKFYVYG